MTDTANNTLEKPRWFGIREAAEYLEIGEQTLYRWMRDGKITYRKVGDSTRFLKEDLDALVEVFPSRKDAARVQEFCPVCHHRELVAGSVRSTGSIFFVPDRTKFWTLKTTNVGMQARMCTRCGAVALIGDTRKLQALAVKAEAHAASVAQSESDSAAADSPAAPTK